MYEIETKIIDRDTKCRDLKVEKCKVYLFFNFLLHDILKAHRYCFKVRGMKKVGYIQVILGFLLTEHLIYI